MFDTGMMRDIGQYLKKNLMPTIMRIHTALKPILLEIVNNDEIDEVIRSELINFGKNTHAALKALHNLLYGWGNDKSVDAMLLSIRNQYKQFLPHATFPSIYKNAQNFINYVVLISTNLN